MEVLMTMILTLDRAANDSYSRLVSDLEIEFGSTGNAALADHFLAAEAIDFHWDARQSERHLGVYESADDEGFELDRVAIIGRLKGRWFVACAIIDGNGMAHDMVWLLHFASEAEARAAFGRLG